MKVSVLFSFLRHAHRSHFWTHPNAKYVIIRRSGQESAFWGFQRLTLKFDLYPQKRKNCDFKLAVNGPSQWEREIFDPPQLGDPSTDFHET